MKKVIIALLVIVSSGCTDTDMASMGAYGNPGHIKVYSGGKLIYEGDSTGRIQTAQNSDGWEFKDAKTGKFIRVSGDTLIEN